MNELIQAAQMMIHTARIKKPQSTSIVGSIRMMPPASLIPRARNPRTHSKEQIAQIAGSMREFGFVNPVLIDQHGSIIAGHGRVEAALLLDMPEVPTLQVDHLTPQQIRAYVIADNKLAENAGWDRELLALELRELSVEVDLDLGVTGFSIPEIDLLLQPDETVSDEEPELVALPKNAVSRPGDLWLIGNHRLLCGDALDDASYRRLLGDHRAGCVFSDPPWNLRVNGQISGLGRVQHREFVMASGEMSEAEFLQFLRRTFGHLAKYSRDGALNYICMDWRHAMQVFQAGGESYTELKNLCVWAKTNAGMGSFYRSQHELVFVYKNGMAAHINNIQLGKHGRNRSNLWSYPGLNAFGDIRDDQLAMHPTVKPVAMVADAILDASLRNDIILDAFVGSGTTLLAAEKTGRKGYGIELDPLYVDLTILRLNTSFGLEACHAEDGRTFHAVQAARLGKEVG